MWAASGGGGFAELQVSLRRQPPTPIGRYFDLGELFLYKPLPDAGGSAASPWTIYTTLWSVGNENNGGGGIFFKNLDLF